MASRTAFPVKTQQSSSSETTIDSLRPQLSCANPYAKPLNLSSSLIQTVLSSSDGSHGKPVSKPKAGALTADDGDSRTCRPETGTIVWNGSVRGRRTPLPSPLSPRLSTRGPMPSPPPAPEESTTAASAAFVAAVGANNHHSIFHGEDDDVSVSGSEDGTEEDDVMPPVQNPTPARATAVIAADSRIRAAAGTAGAASQGRRRRPAAALDDSRRLFQRLFTDDDEIAILEGFYQFTSNRGTAHHAHQHDTGPFYDQIRAKLQLDFSKSQLVEKLRRLKKKFRTAASKVASRRNFAFKSPHDKAAYEISSQIWSTAVPWRGNGDNHDDIEEQNDHDLDNGDRTRKRVRKKSSESAAVKELEAVPVEVKAVPSFTVNATSDVPVLPPAPSSAVLVFGPTDSPPLEVPASVVDETVRSCVAPLFKEVLNCANKWPWMSGNSDVIFPLSFRGSSGAKGSGLEEKWRQQQILELQVFSKRLELVQEKIKEKLEELQGCGR